MAPLGIVHLILYCSMQAGLLDVSLLIVGNKSDLEDRRTVPTENAEQVIDSTTIETLDHRDLYY